MTRRGNSSFGTSIDLPAPHKNQWKILNEARRFNVIACGRRWGKTLLGVNLAAEAALGDSERGIDPGPVGWFAPEYKYLRESWRDLCYILAPAIKRRSDSEKRLELWGGGIIEGWSFDRNPDAGRSRKYRRAIIDEAALTEALEGAWKGGIRPSLTDYRGDAWFLSSPRGKNFFHSLFLRGVSSDPKWRAWAAWQQSSYHNPYIEPAEIDEAREDLGPKFFGQEYLAEFLDDLFEVLFPGDWLDLAERAEYQPAGHRRQAIDLGGGNSGDRSVVLVRDDNGVRDLKASRTWSFEETAFAAAMMAQKHNITGPRTSFDRLGIGHDFGNRLAAVNLRGAVPYVAGEKGGARFANLRSAAAWLARQRLDPNYRPNNQPRPAFSIKAEYMGAMRKELEALRWTLDNERRIKLEPKDELIARIGSSPDFADCFLQSFAYPGT